MNKFGKVKYKLVYYSDDVSLLYINGLYVLVLYDDLKILFWVDVYVYSMKF